MSSGSIRPQLRKIMRTWGFNMGKSKKRGMPLLAVKAASPKWPFAILGRQSPFSKIRFDDSCGFLGSHVGVTDARPAGQGNVHQRFQIARTNAANLDDPGLQVIFFEGGLDGLQYFQRSSSPAARGRAQINDRKVPIHQFFPF